MTPQQESELLRTLRTMKAELKELKEMLNPIAPAKDELLTFKQGAELLKFSVSKLRKLVADGEIPYTKKENRIRFSRNALIQWMNN